MEIKIRNFGKIYSADIEIKGITVVAGNNNTGKTTVGKALFSIFNSVYGMSEKINVTRKKETITRCRNVFRNMCYSKTEEENDINPLQYNLSRQIEMAMHEFTNSLQCTGAYFDDPDEIYDIFSKIADKYALILDDNKRNDFYNLISEELNLINEMKDSTISSEIIERFFKNVFSEQICNLANQNESRLKLEIHGQELCMLFKGNSCVAWEANFEIMHEAFLLDDPFVLDELDKFYRYSMTGLSHRDFLISKIEKNYYDNEETIISSVLAKEKLKEIEQIIENIVPENLEKRNGEWVIPSNEYSEGIRIDNVSAGIKSFLLLKVLLEKGILKEKDVLILDEPEIHLHPEWQIKYAEIIVLLQKMFDLSILVTTHSRDFFEAVELYSKKYSILDKCKFYLSKQGSAGVEFLDVSENTVDIYKHLVDPSRLLDKLKFELEEE